MRESDRAFVLHSWVTSYAARSRDARDYEGAAFSLFSTDYAHIVRDLVSRSNVLVACLKDAPDTVIGWMAIENDALHYVLVKPRWRRMGVARWLLAALAGIPLVVTHRTSLSAKCPVPKEWIYRRFRIWPATKEAS